ncbi:MAG: DEAD/DEAH box helicase family protein [Clostridiales bacterium]|jgi:SNF2 family DNA or RNA helicase|nr:DEAD/DEAH box helicase family protein [Clostridiales bacterium]
MRYLFTLKKELLNLNCLELDGVLARLFDGYEEVIIHKRDEETRNFTVNHADGLLQGKGIKGFFNPIPAQRMFIEKAEGNIFNLDYGTRDYSRVRNLGSSPQRTEKILDAMSGFHNQEEKWFSLFENAKIFMNTNNGDESELNCLQQLQRVEKYQYQIKTVQRILNTFRGRVLLSDEVGLGKTIEAGIAMSEYIMRGLIKKILILVPASLVDQWYYEMKVMFNQDFIRSDASAFRKKGSAAWSEYNKIIASIASSKRKPASETIASLHYDLIIVDEAHHLKNRSSVAWQFVNSLHKKYIFLLSATPVQNSLEELYNLITLLKPGQLRTYAFFKKNFVGDKAGLEVKNNDKLRELLAGAMIRNRKSDIDVKFTKRFATTLTLSAPPRERILYDSLSAFVREQYKSSPISRLTLKNLQEQLGSSICAASRSIRGILENNELAMDQAGRLEILSAEADKLALEESPKLRELGRILKDFDDKLLIFTKFRMTEEYIVDFLRNAGVPTAVFHGSMRRGEKEEQIQYFRDCASVLVSTETGGEGRNLQFCHGMVNFDLPWNPMAIEQRIGRIHRIGQTRDVYVFNLCAVDTVEHYILQILDKKINMFEMAVGEVDMILGDMEDNEDFSEIIMNAWVRSGTGDQMAREIETLGNRLLENKKHYEKIKNIDDKLFADM